MAVHCNFNNLVKLPAQRRDQGTRGKPPSRTTLEDILRVVTTQTFTAGGVYFVLVLLSVYRNHHGQTTLKQLFIFRHHKAHQIPLKKSRAKSVTLGNKFNYLALFNLHGPGILVPCIWGHKKRFIRLQEVNNVTFLLLRAIK